MSKPRAAGLRARISSLFAPMLGYLLPPLMLKVRSSESSVCVWPGDP